jgi:hypothetical protein
MENSNPILFWAVAVRMTFLTFGDFLFQSLAAVYIRLYGAAPQKLRHNPAGIREIIAQNNSNVD